MQLKGKQDIAVTATRGTSRTLLPCNVSNKPKLVHTALRQIERKIAVAVKPYSCLCAIEGSAMEKLYPRRRCN